MDRWERAIIAHGLAEQHGGVAHRRDLMRAGVDHNQVRCEVRAGRWTPAGKHTVVIGSSTPIGTGLAWQAVWESGSNAVLDGAAALLAGGLTGFNLSSIDVAILKNNRHHRVAGVTLHQRRDLGPVIRVGLPRASPETATIRAAQWAVSTRQAALLVCLPVQQRLVAPDRLLAAWSQVQRSPRRRLLDLVIQDVCDGAHSLGELDFARLCRTYGIAPPQRQCLRNGPGGRVYLDAYWEASKWVVEIDGQHLTGLNQIDDALRQNQLSLSSDRVLRIPLVGLRIAEAEFMAQVRQAVGGQ